MTYRVLANSNRIEKNFLRIITGFSEEEQKTIWQILQTYPKGSSATHWTIKKVYRDVWQLDLPEGVVTCWGRAGAVPETMLRRCR